MVLTQKVYEGMYIFDSNRFGQDPNKVSGQISEMVQKAGGEMLVSRLWEERRLAYPIKGHRKGTYWLTYFRLDGDQLTKVERQCQLNDNVLRVLFLSVDPRLVDMLVAHAQSAPVSAPPADVAETEAEPDEAETPEEAEAEDQSAEADEFEA
jgi:small subunit ribosomal protein S6